MSKLPTIQPLKGSDVPSILKPLNQFITDVTRAFNKRLTVTENMDGAIIPVIVDGIFPVFVTWERPNPPVAIWVGKCWEISQVHVVPTVAIGIDWEFYDGKVKINAVPGCPASMTNKFNLTLVAITG